MVKQSVDLRTIRIGRRRFTAAGVLALLGGATISISGCGGGGSSSPSSPSGGPTPSPGPTPASGDRTGSISANHGHAAVLTAAQLQAGGAVTLGIQGAGDHPHSVGLSAAQVQAIASGQRITQESTVQDSHAHDVTFN
jgi:VCBS repeat-containing protein